MIMTQRIAAAGALGLAMALGPFGARSLTAEAQQMTVAVRSPRFLRAPSPKAKPVPVDIRSSTILRHEIALDFEQATVGDVLTAIERQVGVKFIYSRNVVAVDRLVRVRAQRITVAGALTELLIDTGIDVLLNGDHLALVQRPPVALGAGTITGRVSDAEAKLPVAGAEVIVEGTRRHTVSDTAGRYRLTDVDTGRYVLTVRRLGYAKRSLPVVVAEGRVDTVDVALTPMTTRLDELVTTATGLRRRMDIANDITTINADSVVRGEPIRSLTDLLESRVPGLTVQRTSGAPGDPARLRLRGPGSPLRSNDPIVIVDGIRVYAEQSAARSGNLALAGSNADQTSNYATPSPLDYIDPNSIETIEVIKGPSAATLYGQDAANGVIVITTKKGKPGPTQWTMTAEHGRSRMPSRYPDLVFSWGHNPYIQDTPMHCSILGRITQASVGSIVSQQCQVDSVTAFQVLNDPTLTMLDRGRRTAATLGAGGGNSALTYSVTGSYQQELGLVKLPDYEADRYQALLGRSAPDWMRRPQELTSWSARSQVTARLGSKADVSLIASFNRMVQQRSSLERQLGAFMTTYLDQASGVYYRWDPGSFGNVTAVNTNVLPDFFQRVTATSSQFTNGVNVNWRPWQWLNVSSEAGLNVTQRNDEAFVPRGVSGSDTTGRLANGHGSSVVSTVNVRGTAFAPLGLGLQFRFAVGANYTGKSIRDLALSTADVPAGTSGIGTTLSGPPRRTVADEATFGWYVEPTISHRKFSLSTGLRLDGGSSYGGGVTLPAFPKLGLSYLLSEEPFFPFQGLFQSLRLRVAYGRASRQPGIADRLRLYSSTQSQWVDGRFADAVGVTTIGNTQLRPELATEFEGGLEAELLDGRVSLIVTGYRKTTDDVLLSVPLPPSVHGNGVSALKNIGVTRNTGLDVVAGMQLVRSDPLTWSVSLAVSQNRNKVVELGPGVLPFYTENGTTSCSCARGGPDVGGERVAAGYPLFGRWSRPIVGYADTDGNGVLDPGEVLLGDTAVYVGSSLPTYVADLHTTISLWRSSLALTAALHYDDGLSQRNETAQALAPFSAAWNDPNSTIAEQAATIDLGNSSLPARTDYNWIQTVNTLRLGSVSVAYRVPTAVARRIGARTMSVMLQGSNLGLWSNYRGMDPNVNAFGTGNSVTDNGVLPQPRVWQVRVNATY